MRKLLLLATLSALLISCGAKPSDTAATSAASPAAAPAPAATPVAATGKDEPITATQESAGADANPGDASLKTIVAMPDNVLLPSGRWKSGTHYVPVSPAQSTTAEPGQVEVLEFMWLGCPHCAELEPTLEAWAKQKPDYVKFVQEHVMWGPVHRAHGRLLYTLQTLGKGDLVHNAFDEIHQNRNMLVSLKGDDAETQSIQLAFAKANGISEADFKREYNGFTVNARLKRSEEINRRYRIDQVPEIIINGKYRTDVTKAGGKQQLLQLITDLVAAEKKGR